MAVECHLTLMSDLATQTEAWDLIKPVLKKWLSEGATERDAWCLLQWFESVCEVESGPQLKPFALQQKLVGDRKVKIGRSHV